jgi:hypothetical protein
MVVASLAERVGLRVPRRALIVLDDRLTCDDRDPELLALLDASLGTNLGFEVLEGARDLRPEDISRIPADEAAAVAWLDGLVMNPDRSWRNPNMLLWHERLWLVDHGAALFFHHDWSKVTEDSPRRPLGTSAGHAFAGFASRVAEWDVVLAEALSREVLHEAVASVPDEFLRALLQAPTDGAVVRRREAYAAFLWKRLKPPRPFAALA